MTKMEIADKLAALQRMSMLHTELLELGQLKKQILIENRVDDLLPLIQKESKLIKQVGESEQLWLKAIADFLTTKGVKPSSAVTVSEIAELLSNHDEKERLLQLQQELLDKIEQLKQLNAANQQLIEQSLQFIAFSLDMMSGAPDEEAFYQHPTKHHKNRSGLFDTKA